jgi:hypothetical protein
MVRLDSVGLYSECKDKSRDDPADLDPICLVSGRRDRDGGHRSWVGVVVAIDLGSGCETHYTRERNKLDIGSISQ